MADQWDQVAAAMREAVEDAVAAVGTQTPPPTPPPVTPTVIPPVDLRRWKLTIPEVKDGKVVEIKPPALSTYQDKYFERLADGSTRFRVWHGGDTTSGSSNPRSELRELNADGSLAKWSTRKGAHGLTVDLQVNRLTKVKPEVVLAQIHGGDDDVTVFRLEGAKLYVTDGDDTHAHLVTDTFELGRRYELQLAVSAGEIRYGFEGRYLDHVLKVDDDSCYFKTGNYLQSNPKTAKGESTDEFAEVVVHSAVVNHQ